MSLAAFVFYAFAVLVVHGEEKQGFVVERSSLAAAASNISYQAPFGAVYASILARFLETNVPIDEILTQVARRDLQPGPLLGSTADGNGIGYIAASTLAMRMLGLSTRSVVVVMLSLMFVSALAFLWRYREDAVPVVILYFASLTLMLFTPLVWSPATAVQIPPGGIRYFSLVAILPAYHLLYELFDRRRATIRLGAFLPTVIQVAIVLLAILVRNSAAPMIVALAAGGLFVVWQDRRLTGTPVKVLRKMAYMAMVGIVFVGVLMTLVSRTYLSEGRFTETVWHRIFVSLGLSPAWPFGRLREIYDCRTFIPEGLVGGPEDRNGHCILWAYAIKHNIPQDVVPTMTYGRQYDAALREAFFNIARLYPMEMLKTFAYYKIGYIPWSIAVSTQIKLSDSHPLLVWLLALSLGNVLLYCLLSSGLRSPRSSLFAAGCTALLALSTVPPLLAVWAMPHTSADLLFYCFFGLGLMVIIAAKKVHQLM